MSYSALEILKADLEVHTARRDLLASGKAGFFIKREGYPISGLIASYDKIILSLKEEIAEREGKKSKAKAKAKAKAKSKTPTKKK